MFSVMVVGSVKLTVIVFPKQPQLLAASCPPPASKEYVLGVPPLSTQKPNMHCESTHQGTPTLTVVVQALPQLPQLLASLATLTHPPAHTPSLHVSGHDCWLDGHAPVVTGHVVQFAPPLPHAAVSVPTSQVDPLQQPAHDFASHMQLPFTHSCPLPHPPLAQWPPQPSLAPQALPVQLGTHSHVPVAEHVRGEVHALPGQHACPLPPQVPQVALPHGVPGAQVAHAAPPVPHAESLVPAWQKFPEQQPLHDVGSQVQAPLAQWSPLGQAPSAQMPPQSSLAPQALPAQVGEQAPTPHTLGMPPPRTTAPSRTRRSRRWSCRRRAGRTCPRTTRRRRTLRRRRHPGRRWRRRGSRRLGNRKSAPKRLAQPPDDAQSKKLTTNARTSLGRRSDERPARARCSRNRDRASPAMALSAYRANQTHARRWAPFNRASAS